MFRSCTIISSMDEDLNINRTEHRYEARINVAESLYHCCPDPSKWMIAPHPFIQVDSIAPDRHLRVLSAHHGTVH